ncbi:MAG: hypothetical protein ACTSWN_13600 [Promethearchaeota archaeon]
MVEGLSELIKRVGRTISRLSGSLEDVELTKTRERSFRASRKEFKALSDAEKIEFIRGKFGPDGLKGIIDDVDDFNYSEENGATPLKRNIKMNRIVGIICNIIIAAVIILTFIFGFTG